MHFKFEDICICVITTQLVGTKHTLLSCTYTLSVCSYYVLLACTCSMHFYHAVSIHF